jgi:hypothetical protein
MRGNVKVSPGPHYPLGTTVMKGGVSLLLFDDPSGPTLKTITLENRAK